MFSMNLPRRKPISSEVSYYFELNHITQHVADAAIILKKGYRVIFLILYRLYQLGFFVDVSYCKNVMLSWLYVCAGNSISSEVSELWLRIQPHPHFSTLLTKHFK